MKFINPKIDFAFKRIFGSEQSHDILISFLNAMLYEGLDIIQDLEILDPYLAPKIRGIKDTYVDVKANIRNQEGEITSVIIEMQVLNVEGFEKRILYNASKAYSTQLDIGEDYTILQPVIALTITDFEMFPELEQILSRFILKEKTYLTDYPVYDIELVFIELPKFKKELEELETITDKWLYFLKTARKLDAVPTVMDNEPAIKKAFAIASQANLSKQELDDLERRSIFIHDQRNALKKATRLGLEQGKKEGIQQGIQQGIEQGIEQGELKAKLAIAQQLLAVLDDEAICQSTGLSVDAITKLRNG
ncbi:MULTISPECIES: Rpn family recombination-promoting nuclease/putative transposase [Pseudanabaena]|uniref:Rpn family recombination-promoting nuclease/putative transposase n=1 Tax=Pseudanabaena TaxID=1152 RepID=UPI0024790720|nr:MULTISPECIES: Rpn family recombination-promoting nuclease/putative transposase [Pseudanabaena]MEA5487277.1 Rpn family recombination-promoting nuclease/putative transposase [Pseudanabaena sp. CCNP1317]WGS70494.1 Rpn family recombination-promoting nuclease/putative transposase [Pseudanabaena galeata CCNP1313]